MLIKNLTFQRSPILPKPPLLLLLVQVREEQELLSASGKGGKAGIPVPILPKGETLEVAYT